MSQHLLSEFPADSQADHQREERRRKEDEIRQEAVAARQAQETAAVAAGQEEELRRQEAQQRASRALSPPSLLLYKGLNDEAAQVCVFLLLFSSPKPHNKSSLASKGTFKARNN